MAHKCNVSDGGIAQQRLLPNYRVGIIFSHSVNLKIAHRFHDHVLG